MLLDPVSATLFATILTLKLVARRYPSNPPIDPMVKLESEAPASTFTNVPGY